MRGDIMFLFDLIDFFLAQISSAFISIQPDNLLGEFYLIGNFFLLLFASLFGSGSGGGFSLF
jgi:hypothetical protein